MGDTDWKAEGPAHMRYIYSFVFVSTLLNTVILSNYCYFKQHLGSASLHGSDFTPVLILMQHCTELYSLFSVLKLYSLFLSFYSIG